MILKTALIFGGNMNRFEESKEYSKCGNTNVNVELKNTYYNPIGLSYIRFKKDSEDYLYCSCDKCGHRYYTKTKDSK